MCAWGLGTESHICSYKELKIYIYIYIKNQNKDQPNKKGWTKSLTFWISSLRTGSKFSSGVYKQTRLNTIKKICSTQQGSLIPSKQRNDRHRTWIIDQ